MNYDKNSFLAGMAVGRWLAGRAGRGGGQGQETPEAGVVGVCWNRADGSTALTRLTAESDPNRLVTVAIGAGPVAAAGTLEGSSPFDTMMPWAGMKEYNILADGTAVKSGDPRFSRKDNDTVVYIPEFGYRAIFDGEEKVYFYISSVPTKDCPKHPGSGRYVAKYPTGEGHVSKSGLKPKAIVSRTTFRNGARSKGKGWSAWSYDTWCAIGALILLEWADWDTQGKIGRGCVDYGAFGGSAPVSGGTDEMTYHTGTPQGTNGRTATMYRWIEGLWGGIRQLVDGCNVKDGEVYFCLDPEKFADDTQEGYTKLDVQMPNASGTIRGLAESRTANWAFCPTTEGSGNIPDNLKVVSTGGEWWTLNVGGMWREKDMCGMFNFSVDYMEYVDGDPDFDRYMGSRLQYTP